MEMYSISLVIREKQIKLTKELSACTCYLIRKKGHGRCDEGKELGTERSSWIIQVDPKCHNIPP